MNSSSLRRVLLVYVLLLLPICWLAARFYPYRIDGDSVSYMDIADLIRTHQWAGVVNSYWHPLYPAVLALGQMLFHPTRLHERAVYVTMNYGVFLLEAVAMWVFAGALVRLRTSMSKAGMNPDGGAPLLSLNAMRLLSLALLMASSQSELAMGYIRTDGLLQALLLLAFAMMLRMLATDHLLFAPAVGLFLGLAYLTKSFAFLVALLTILAMMAFQAWVQRRPLVRVVAGGALAGIVFACVAGPYMVALSYQKHRFDFGDSGSLNFAWFVAGTQKLHLEPDETTRMGNATVHLVHPVPRLLAWPAIYSYKQLHYGTYPDWFDPTYFNEQIKPHINLKQLAHKDGRNAVLIVRYLLNHPAGWVLLALLLLWGAKINLRDWRRGFWLPTLLLGSAMWGIYSMVNIEERYVTAAYFITILTLFATLTSRRNEGQDLLEEGPDGSTRLQRAASAMVVLLAFVVLGESLATSLENRRNVGILNGHELQIYGAAAGLADLGVNPGDEVACVETLACVNDPYWARLAGVRVLTEVSNTGSPNLIEELNSLPNRQQVYDVVKGQGAKVLVGYFDPGTMNQQVPASEGWVRLGGTNFYALPLNLVAPIQQAPSSRRWTDGDMDP